MNNDDFNIFELGNVKLLSGEILYSAKLAYKTYGLLNTNKDNVILLPTFYTCNNQIPKFPSRLTLANFHPPKALG